MTTEASPLIQGYLIAFNLLSAALWLYVLVRAVQHMQDPSSAPSLFPDSWQSVQTVLRKRSSTAYLKMGRDVSRPLSSTHSHSSLHHAAQVTLVQTLAVLEPVSFMSFILNCNLKSNYAFFTASRSYMYSAALSGQASSRLWRRCSADFSWFGLYLINFLSKQGFGFFDIKSKKYLTFYVEHKLQPSLYRW